VSRDGGGLLSSLRHRDFAWLMGAFGTSSIGTWAYSVGLAVWLLEETGSPGWVAASTAARFVPSLLLSPYGGVLADRFERVRLMRLLDVVLCVLMLALAAETALGASPWVVIATVVLASSTGTSYEPATAALTPQVVPEQALGAANALRNTIDNVCVIAGPALGVGLLLLGPTPVAVLLSAATFAVSAMLVAGIRTRGTPVDVTEGGEAGIGDVDCLAFSQLRLSVAVGSRRCFVSHRRNVPVSLIVRRTHRIRLLAVARCASLFDFGDFISARLALACDEP